MTAISVPPRVDELARFFERIERNGSTCIHVVPGSSHFILPERSATPRRKGRLLMTLSLGRPAVGPCREPCSNGTWLTPVRDWYIDAQTLLPVCLETNGLPQTEYRYTRINQPIPDEEFQPKTGSGIQIKDAEPLDEGYTRRFLNVILPP